MIDLKRRNKISKKIKINKIRLKNLNLEVDLIKSKLEQSEVLKNFRIFGSFSRNTFVKYPKDIDFFLYFYEPLEKIPYLKILEDLKKIFPNVQLMNRGHPYYIVNFKINEQNLNLEFVPCCLSEKTAVSNTEKHNTYCLQNLTEELRNQIRLLKYLLKRNNLLDAHSKVRGFSSFCVEALIIKYKKIEEIPILDCFFDPVDPLRNLFASISNENLFKFYLLQKTDFKFKKDLDYLNSDLYILKKAPLSLIERLKRDPHVVSVVYIRENILVELIDYLWAPKKKLSLDSQFWGENNEFQKFYFNSKKVYKKTSKKVFFKRYSNFKFEKVKETDKALQKTYNFFK